MSDHYKKHPTGIECRTICEHFPYNVGVAMAYLWRHEHKGQPVTDLLKAIEHIKFEIERISIDRVMNIKGGDVWEAKQNQELTDNFADDVDPKCREA